MGVVYKALDTHLDRAVALKVLPAGRVEDPERKRRFVQEAKAASALNHPNIVTIYDIGQEGGVDYIAMEFVDGKTLDEATPRGGMKVGEAVKLAVQIADALAKAHLAGITHRDLKPGNIMVDAAGRVKILDFGLAKLTDKAESTDSEKTLVAKPATTEGSILGTVNYMSPEQAEGKKVDPRSDIFSFGAVLYEMLTGQRAFQGETTMSTLAAVIHKDPRPLAELMPVTPRELDKIIGRCLRKDRERRSQSIVDVRNALEEVGDAPAAALAQVAKPGRRWLWPLVIGASLVAGLAVGAGLYLMRGRGIPLVASNLRRLTADGGLTFEPALSADGKLVAFASDRSGEGNLDLWVQHITGGDAIRLTRHEADDHQPAFSPDGGTIAFRSGRDGGGIYVMPALGGDARLVAKNGFRPRFSPDGSRIAYYVTALGTASGTTRSELYVVAVAGGQPVRLAEGLVARDPIWSPDGGRILFVAHPQPKQGQSFYPRNIWTVSAQGGEPVECSPREEWTKRGLTPASMVPESWSSDGKWLYLSGEGAGTKNILRAGITGAGKLTGVLEPVTMGTTEAAQVSISKDGLMAFASTTSRASIWAQGGDMNAGKVSGAPVRITTSMAIDERPRVSKDGKKLSYVSSRLGRPKIFLRDLVSGKDTVLTPGGRSWYWPVISGDGSRFAFDDQDGFYVAGQSANPEKVRIRSNPWDMSRDGRLVLLGGGSREDLIAFDFDAKTEYVVAKKRQLQLLSPVFSNDMKWIALHTRNSEVARQIHVFPFHEKKETMPEEWIAITDGKGLERDPEWSPDGNLLYWQTDRDGFRCYMAQKLDPVSKKPVGAPFFVQHFHDPSRSLLFFTNTGSGSPTIAPDRMYYAIGERTGNIWLMQVQP